jgi:hypothetical protein
MSITAVLLPSVTYLLTLPCTKDLRSVSVPGTSASSVHGEQSKTKYIPEQEGTETKFDTSLCWFLEKSIVCIFFMVKSIYSLNKDV